MITFAVDEARNPRFMQLTRLYSAGLNGLEAFVVTIEVGMDNGFGFRIVGLADSGVRESFHRIRAAIGHNGHRLPGRKIVVNLGPAHQRKAGSLFDLPIALGILISSGQIRNRRDSDLLFLGELALNGELRAVRGLVALIIHASASGLRRFVVPRENAMEASLIPGITLYPAGSLAEAIDFLEGRKELCGPVPPDREGDAKHFPDVSEVYGQPEAVRALEIAATGGHHLLLAGPQGTGKSLLAERLPFLLPPLLPEESLEVARIYSAAGYAISPALLNRVPIRKPHHSIGRAAFLGGGAIPVPGELTLAHRGVLIMDEMQLFDKALLDLLRGPMEEGRIRINRLRYACEYPCSFLLIGTANLYPSSSIAEGEQEQNKRGILAAPLLDRMDLQVFMDRPTQVGRQPGNSSREIRERVQVGREIQRRRYAEEQGWNTNSSVPGELLNRYCPLGTAERSLIGELVDKLGFSLRGRDQLIRIARTLADMDGEEQIRTAHLAEAAQFRNLDRVASV